MLNQRSGGSAFTDIEDVVLFVKWLNDDLSYLVDERAVLKHFDWPEQKVDALHEAAFGYFYLKKLESEASSFRYDPRQPCGPALKKMQALLEKLEHGVNNISRMREAATNRYKVFQIPVHWMLCKIKI
ncbi:protein CHUP1, chloroplastic-like [Lotus japonicus]|uniref:protein CHUP1, chloroplastic-like n=1 Tax=Lotus japonicus TaxID=34305 RepID=UPI002584844B|nr:protein CHUP1, chloroplastic-like [Lotus japonicus]